MYPFTVGVGARITLLIGVCITTATLGSSIAWAAENDDEQMEQRRIADLVEDKQCIAAWDALWSRVMDGSPRAGGYVLGMAYIGLLPPLTLPEPQDGDYDDSHPQVKHLLAFVADVGFAIDVRALELPMRTEFQEARREFIRSTWSSNALQRYEAAGCFGPNPAASCWEPAQWSPEVRSLKDWDAELSKNQKLGVNATCFEPLHAYRENTDAQSGEGTIVSPKQ